MRQTTSLAIGATVIGAALLAIGACVDPARMLLSYLTAWIFAVSIAVAALLWVQMAHTLGAGWMVVLRRRAEDVLAALPLLAVLFLPILFGLSALYPWARPEGQWSEALHEAMGVKRGWLSGPFFGARSFLYLGVWTIVAELLRRYSRAQDRSASPELVRRLKTIAVGALPPVAFLLTFASFDWLMSLDPTWSSTVFGIYLFGGSFGAAVGLLCFVAFGPLASRIEAATAEHSHALGRILLTFVIFWTYIAFAQFFLVWIADLPDEVGWVKLRTTESWGSFAVLLVAIHFVIPFFVLLSRELKRRPRGLAWMGLWLFVAHYLDIYWLVVPSALPAFEPHLLDVGLDAAALLFVTGACLLVVLLRARAEPAMPLHDPRLEAGLSYEAS
jgi:hypothetical protein